MELPASPSEDTHDVVEGWVRLLDKRPGDNVFVEMSTGGSDQLYHVVDPFTFTFTELGTRYFNVTVFLKEDNPPGESYQMFVRAFASTLGDSTDDAIVLTVHSTWFLAAEAELIEPPREVVPGRGSTGIVEVINTGSRWAAYELTLEGDPDGVVSSIRFEQEVQLLPNFWEKAEFRVKTRDDATPGTHRVSIALTTTLDDGTAQRLDGFSFDLEVEEPQDRSPAGPVLVLVLAVIACGLAVAYHLRRKAK